MRSRAVALYPLAVAVALIFGLPGCGSSSGPTTPPGGLELNSGNIPPGGVYQHAFANAGTFAYHCTIHAAMTGNKVVVDAAASADSAVVSIVSASSPGFSPSSVTIKPGGHVRWVNAHSMTHTVTSGS
jgi:plastocyanin